MSERERDTERERESERERVRESEREKERGGGERGKKSELILHRRVQHCIGLPYFSG